jgi:lysophospholipase L1-like esterase
VAAETASEHLAVLVDGQEKAVLRKPGRVRLTLSDLGPGEHLIRLQKLTESQTGGAKFFGFSTGKGTFPLPPPHRARQIEFIGDSYTVGYGDVSPSRTCTPDQVHDLTDTRLAFGPRLAERLGADYRVNAWSGYGVARNWAGGHPEESALSVYPRLIPGDPARADPGSPTWRPQLIVIGLGTNDFSTPLHAGERWADQAALRADYRARYEAFVRELMRRQPQARFVLMANADWAGEVEAVAAALERPDRVKVLSFHDLELTGCNFHPSAHDHQVLADSLFAKLAEFPDLWASAP